MKHKSICPIAMKISDHAIYRCLEILPGLSIWGTLIIALILSIIRPLWMIYFIIVFDVYWVLRVLYFVFYLLIAWNRFKHAIKIDWFRQLNDHYQNWEDKINVVFLPLYNESWEVIKTSLESIKKSTYPHRKIYIVMAGEGRQLEHWQKIQARLKIEYTNQFADLIFFTHPADLQDEIHGKGSNINFAEKEFKKYADAKIWDYKKIIVSVFDIDTVVHPEYFAHLTYIYCLHPRPERSSFQPLTLYNNNIWESPAILRIMAFGTSFWILFSLARLDHLVTFSSHSMSFQAIVDCGGHAKDIVSEDSRIFFQCWLRYDGDYEVTPLYIPVSMDTVREDGWWQSLKNLYYQQRRWAWGTEHIPYLLWNLRNNKKISLADKFMKIFHEWEGKWSWGVVAILITIVGQLPLRVINWSGDSTSNTLLFFSAPYILQILMTLSMLGLMVSAILSMLVLPRRPNSYSPYRYGYMILQWILLPVSMIFLSAIPCIDAVTHLMLGKYLGFNVSVKRR